MKELFEMSEAHLRNVRQEMDKLITQREQVDQELANLQQYLEHGIKTLEKYKSEVTDQEKA